MPAMDILDQHSDVGRTLHDESPQPSNLTRQNVNQDPTDELREPLASLLTHARHQHATEPSLLSANISTSSVVAALDAEEVAVLDKWSPCDISRVIRSQGIYSTPRLHDHKRDLDPEFDAVILGLVSESRVTELFDA